MIGTFPVGTKFRTGGKHPRICTVIDIYTTKNSFGNVVSIRYVATHEFAGQTVTEQDIAAPTIARGLLE